MESHISDQIFKAFGNLSLYDILGVKPDSSVGDIKKAYKRLALIHHPDKGGDPEKFKAISIIHVILSDPEKRKLYDADGELDESELSDEAAHWYEYFRALFPRVNPAAIDDFSKSYKHSDEERDDIIREYIDKGGNFESIMECIMLAEDEDEARIMSIIDGAIESGEIDSTPVYEAHKKKFLKRKPSKSKTSKGTEGTTVAVMKLNKRQKAKGVGVENEDSLEAMILSRNRDRSAGGVLADIMKKYGVGENIMDNDIPDDEFEAVRSRIGKKQQSKGSSTSSKTRKGKLSTGAS